MKKAIYVLIALVIAFAMASCDAFGPPELLRQSEYDDGLGPLQPGEFFVGLSKSSRALTAPLARAGADFFEVVFSDGPTSFTRATLREGGVVRMRAPSIGDYNNTGTLRAYVFAGRNETKTLLGIGMIGEVDNGTGSAAGTNITDDTISVTFYLEALTTNISPNTATSTFTISGTNTGVMTVPGTTNPAIPVFLFPGDTDSGLTATFNYRITDSHTFGVNLFSSIVFADAVPFATVTTREFILEGHDQPLAKVNAAVAGTPVVSAAPNNIALTLNITTEDENGLGLLYVEIPVHLLDAAVSTSPAAVQWYIRGGLNNALVDAGITANEHAGSQGGAVITGVGSVFDGAGFEVIVKSDPTP